MIWINDKLIENKRFPNNEILLDTVGILKASNFGMNEPNIRFKYTTDSDLIELFMVKSYITDMLKKGARINLEIMYMPYSRMDRVKDEKDAFTLRYISEFINNMGFNHIRIMEAHSDVCLALVNARNIPITKKLVERLYKDGIITDKDTLFFPDAGAQKKYEDVLPNLNRLIGYKVRDWNTGKITKYVLFDPTETSGCNAPETLIESLDNKIFIVDDLCSYGGTAFNAALEITKCYAFAEVNLIVAHCEDSIFKGKLLLEDSPVNHIYTTDTLISVKKHDKISIYEAQDVMQ